MAERFSAIMMADHPPNFRLLPSFSNQVLGPDGVFLNPVSGLHYVLHLFDSTEAALQSGYLGTDQQLLLIKETVRQSNDRVAYLESRHGGLQRQVDHKTASDAELTDWMLNRSEEDWMVVGGLPRLTGANWQDAARRQVADAIKLALHVNRANVTFEVMYVSNPLRYQPNRQNLYNVRMDSVASSKRIREIYSGFFRHNRPVALPPPLKGVSIRNKVTPDTKIRISILHQLGSIYQESARGASYKVTGHDSRPLLITLPPSSSTERQRTYTFMQAVTLLPANFSDEHLIRIYQVVSGQQQGRLQSLFVVLNDDDRERCLEMVKQQRASGRGPVNRQAASASASLSGAVSGSGSGMDLAASALSPSTARTVTFDDLQQPPPPPPAIESDTTRSKKGSSGSHHRSPTPDARDGEIEGRKKARDREESSEREKERESESERREKKNPEKKSKGVRRRRSSSSSQERETRKRSKKSKSKRRHRSPSSSSSSGSGSSSDSYYSTKRSHSKSGRKSSPKARER